MVSDTGQNSTNFQQEPLVNDLYTKEKKLFEDKKYHTLDPKKKPIYLIIAMVSIFIIVPALFYFYYQVALNRPAQNDREKIFRIHKGETASSISSRLYEENLINSKALFDIYVILNGLQSNLQAGLYKVPAGTNVKDLVALFGRGTDDVKVTFLEGWRVEEIASEADAKFDAIDYKEFVGKAKHYEGRLFPDTYEFNANVDEEEIINTMVDNFKAKTAAVLTEENLSKVGLSKDQAIILASIVEREVQTSEDMALVAGILIKRFKNNMLLGADATTQYAVAPKIEGDKKIWWPRQLTLEDLASDSPYNTRKNLGLPPGPICNPSLRAIKAVVNPKQSEFYYYLTDVKGVTHYAITLEEHNKNIQEFL